MQSIVFQELECDYVDDADPQWVASAIRTGIQSEAGYSCTIYLVNVASASAQMYVARFATGYSLVCVKLEGEPQDIPALQAITYYATGDYNDETILRFRAGQTKLIAPLRLLVSDASVMVAVSAFMQGECLATELKWIDVANADFEVYE